MARIRWKNRLTGEALQPLVQTARQSILLIQLAIDARHPFMPYDAGGAQQARTTVAWPPRPPQQYVTTMQQHSEMVSLGASTGGVDPIWKVTDEGHVKARNNHPIAAGNYFTNLPHCGYCTVMLWVLGLPLGVPTEGRYNLAVNLEYTVPADVSNNVELLGRLLNSNVGGSTAMVVLKRMVNAFIQNPSHEWVLKIEGFDEGGIPQDIYVNDNGVTALPPPATEVLDWYAQAAPHPVNVDEMYFGANSLLRTLWKIVYKGIYENVA